MSSETVTYKDPKSGREQTFGAWEQTRQRLLQGIGWQLVEDEPEPTDDVQYLPDDFPGVDLLFSAGLATVADVKEIDDLTALNGIGKATAAKIEAALQEL